MKKKICITLIFTMLAAAFLPLSVSAENPEQLTGIGTAVIEKSKDTAAPISEEESGEGLIHIEVDTEEDPALTVPDTAEDSALTAPDTAEDPALTAPDTAEDSALTASDTAEDSAPKSSHINLHIDMEKRMCVTDSVAVFELYSASGELLGTAEKWIGGNIYELDMSFEVPEYTIGEQFRLRLADGLRSLTYNTDKVGPGGEMTLRTYCYRDENDELIIGDSFIMSAEPEFEKAVVVYIDNKLYDFYPRARIVDGVAMAPVYYLAQALRVKAKYDEDYDSYACSVGDDYVFFNNGTSYTTAFGNDFYAPHISCIIDETFFVPIRTFADCFECSIEVYEQYDHIDVCLGESAKVRNYFNSSPVNQRGISSRTKNLIWVSKSEYLVRVYEGSQYNWELINSFPCGIGAYGSPTITGQFEYIERIRSWDYANYYVGPVLRFYNGYAIHSTLLRYGGGEYDGTVRAHISHGCVRCHPWDINWLDQTVSLGTRIYITD